MTFDPGDWVCVDITDETDPDIQWHGKQGEIVDVLKDGAGEVTGDDRDSRLYRVEIDDYDHVLNLRQRDLRSPFD